jgi:hypothetical protein
MRHPVRVHARRLPIAEAGVAIAALLSVVVLAGMMAAPLMPVPTLSPLPTPAPPTPAPSDASIPVPIGLYVAREPISFGPCVAFELTIESYAVGDAGHATVHHWERGMTGCDTRSTDVRTTEADVRAVPSDDGGIAGYSLQFALPLPGGGVAINNEVVILMPDGANAPLLQALEVSADANGGMVLDLAAEVAPSLVPIPSPAD